MHRLKLALTALAAAAMLLGMAGAALAQDADEPTTYRAVLEPMNAGVVGSEPTGEVMISIEGGQTTIEVTVEGAPPDIQHWQHLHGFADGCQPAVCPTDDADANDDGIVDLIETEAVAGTTMVPFNEDPASLEIPTDTYPVADAYGAYTYEVTVPLDELEEAFNEQFPDAGGLDWENRVVFIHGIPEATELLDTVQSLGDIPAQVTLPIACGGLDVVSGATPVASPEPVA